MVLWVRSGLVRNGDGLADQLHVLTGQAQVAHPRLLFLFVPVCFLVILVGSMLRGPVVLEEECHGGACVEESALDRLLLQGGRAREVQRLMRGRAKCARTRGGNQVGGGFKVEVGLVGEDVQRVRGEGGVGGAEEDGLQSNLSGEARARGI